MSEDEVGPASDRDPPPRARPTPHRARPVPRPEPGAASASAPAHASDPQPVSDPADGVGDKGPAETPGRRLLARLSATGERRRRHGADDEDPGPFFPPEIAAITAPTRSHPSPGASPTAATAPQPEPEQPESEQDESPRADSAVSGEQGRPRPAASAPEPSAPEPVAPAGATPPAPALRRPAPGARSAGPTAGPSGEDPSGELRTAGKPPAGDATDGRVESPPASTPRVDISRFIAATAPAASTPTPATQAPRVGYRERLRRSRPARTVVRIVIVLAVTVAAALVLRTYVVTPYYIPSASMEPTLHGCTGCNDDHVLVDKISYRFHSPHVGDIVVFDRPKNLDVGESVLIKRVIAVGGDTLTLRGGLVYVDGARMQENYVNKACGPDPSTPENGTSSWTVPNNDVFVMGDNRCDSLDSRDFGPIPISTIVGRAFLIIWPVKRIGTL